MVEQAGGRKVPGDFPAEMARGEDVVEGGDPAGGRRLAGVSDQGEQSSLGIAVGGQFVVVRQRVS